MTNRGGGGDLSSGEIAPLSVLYRYISNRHLTFKSLNTLLINMFIVNITKDINL